MIGYDRKLLAEVVVYHHKVSIEGCLCGWSQLGRSIGEHVADVYEKKFLETLAPPGCMGYAQLTATGAGHTKEPDMQKSDITKALRNAGLKNAVSAESKAFQIFPKDGNTAQVVEVLTAAGFPVQVEKGTPWGDFAFVPR